MSDSGWPPEGNGHAMGGGFAPARPDELGSDQAQQPLHDPQQPPFQQPLERSFEQPSQQAQQQSQASTPPVLTLVPPPRPHAAAPGPATAMAAVAVDVDPSTPRRLQVQHDTEYRYDTAVEVAHHAAWLRPRETEWQRIVSWSILIEPSPSHEIQVSQDVFGNWRHGFNHARVHDALRVESYCVAEISAPPVVDPLATPPWEQVAEELQYRSGVQQPEATQFALGSHYAPVHRLLADHQADLLQPGRPVLDLALALNHAIYTGMTFEPDSTDVATDALGALASGKGVCQDFAHLMIGVLRSWGLAARYVSGYLLTHPPAGQPRLIGADASHAWVSVWCGESGWVMLDPTNDLVVGRDHVTLAWGRDYADVAPLRGVIRGGGNAPPDVAVTVTPLD